MGRGYQDQSWESWQSPSRSWQLWSGARKPPKGKGKQKNPSDAQFPAYDADRKQAGRNGWDRDKDYAAPSSEPAGLTQLLQTSLNGTRKAEQRVISLTEALANREKLWLQYEKDLKAAYQREFARFTKDIEKLKDDLQKAKAAQAGARADLLRTFQGHQEPAAAIEDPMADVIVCLLAFPEWAAAGPLILVDARQVDGRLFCCEMQGALSRSSFLMQIGVEDRPGLCITVAGYEWPWEHS